MMEIWPLGNLGQDKSRWILRYEGAPSHTILIVNSNEVPLDSLSSYFGLIYTFEPGMQDIGYVEGQTCLLTSLRNRISDLRLVF